MSRQRRPDTTAAMAELIGQIRSAIPLDLPEAQVCSDSCNACSLKLLEYLSAELENWESRLAAGEKPGLADLSQLARSARKIHRVLQKNGLIEEGEHTGA
ncbi:hypothetical protein [Thiolapillus sp.]